MTAAPARNPLLLSLLAATLIIAHQVAAKATRDAVFLSQFSVTELPKIVIAAALVSMLGVISFSGLLSRFGPSRVIPAAFVLSAIGFYVSWLVYAHDPKVVALTLYLQVALFGAILISGFWSLVNEMFDPHEARRTITRIAAAATFGGVIGGLLAGSVTDIWDVRTMLAVLAVLHLMCAVIARGIGRVCPAVRQEKLAIRSGFQVLSASPYLIAMAALVISIAILGALVDYAFKAEASAMFSDERSLARFFGTFYAVTGVVTFVLQSSLGPYVMQRFGLRASIALLPAIVIAAGAAHLLLARAGSAMVLRAAQVACANSFFRASFETLYTPLPPAQKRPTKTIVDVAADRLGDIIGGSVLLGLLAGIPAATPTTVTLVAIVFACISLALAAKVYSGYVAQLAENLRDGAAPDAEPEPGAAVARPGSTERALLAARFRDLKFRRIRELVPVFLTDIALSRGRTRPRAEPSTQLAATLADLCSGDIARIRSTLRGDFMDVRLAPFLIELLEIDELVDDITTELHWLVPRCPGLLADALLDPDIALRARQRLPAVLEVSHSPRALLALELGLGDSEFNVRCGCARAVARMRARDRDIVFAEDRIYDLIRTEFATDPCGAATATAGGPSLRNLTHGVEHVFTLLSLVHDRDAINLCLRALYSNDRALRGSALEYLDNVLPDNIRTELWAYLGLATESIDGQVSSGRIITDLLQDMREVLQPQTR